MTKQQKKTQQINNLFRAECNVFVSLKFKKMLGKFS